MPISHGVLAALANGPDYGYRLGARLSSGLGADWGDINMGHLYQVLDRLRRDGFVTTEQVRQVARPDRRIFTITDAGRGELDRWLDEPSAATTGYRDELLLKLIAASHVNLRALRRVITRERSAHLGELRGLTEALDAAAGDALARLQIEAAITANEARLRVLDIAERDAIALAKQVRHAASDEPRTARKQRLA